VAFLLALRLRDTNGIPMIWFKCSNCGEELQADDAWKEVEV
jgi:hypothetical protein